VPAAIPASVAQVQVYTGDVAIQQRDPAQSIGKAIGSGEPYPCTHVMAGEDGLIELKFVDQVADEPCGRPTVVTGR